MQSACSTYLSTGGDIKTWAASMSGSHHSATCPVPVARHIPGSRRCHSHLHAEGSGCRVEHILVFGTWGGAALPYPDMVHAGVSVGAWAGCGLGAGCGHGAGGGRSQDIFNNQLTFLNIYVCPPHRFPAPHTVHCTLLCTNCHTNK